MVNPINCKKMMSHDFKAGCFSMCAFSSYMPLKPCHYLIFYAQSHYSLAKSDKRFSNVEGSPDLHRKWQFAQTFSAYTFDSKVDEF